MKTEENIFESAEISEELPSEAPDMDEDPANAFAEVWKPSIPKESPAAKKLRVGEKKSMNDKILTIQEVFYTRPKFLNTDGTKIEPKKTLDKVNPKFFYPGKLGIRFEEDNLVEYYPNYHYFITEDGKVSNVAKINRDGKNAIAKLFQLVVAKLNKPIDEIADQDFYEYLIGKKVKIKTDSDVFNGKPWFRNDIVEIVK